jgi:hypothetical protein
MLRWNAGVSCTFCFAVVASLNQVAEFVAIAGERFGVTNDCPAALIQLPQRPASLYVEGRMKSARGRSVLMVEVRRSVSIDMCAAGRSRTLQLLGQIAWAVRDQCCQQ